MTADPVRLSDDDLVNAERWVLGSIIIAGFDCLGDAPITASDFAEPRHEELFLLMRSMKDAGQHIDQLSIARHLKRTPIRGVESSYLWVLKESVIQTVSAEFHAMHVIEEAHYRRLGAVAARFRQMVEERTDVDAIADRVREWLIRAEVSSPTTGVSMGDAIAQVFDEAPEEQVHTPWTELDDLIGGWRPGRLYVIGARPGIGKTVLGLNAAVHHARSTRTAIAVVNMEMTTKELTKRALCSIAGVDFSRLDRRVTNDAEDALLSQAAGFLQGVRIIVDDKASQKPAQVRAFARSVANRERLGMVVVDYLQLMAEDSKSQNSDSRQQQVAAWSRAMKVMARDLEVPVIVLSQLNRGPEGRPPRLSDLRDSGAVEQDADVVLLLSKDDEDHLTQWMTVDVAKNRQGPTGAFQLPFEGKFMRLGEAS